MKEIATVLLGLAMFAGLHSLLEHAGRALRRAMRKGVLFHIYPCDVTSTLLLVHPMPPIELHGLPDNWAMS